jgi:phage terminase large subunit GpA-like protein
MSTALDDLRTAGASAWRPKPFTSLADWCEEHIRLSPDWEATPGRYNLAENPFWREVIDAFLDPEVRHITLKKSTQVGGTLLLNAVALGLSELDPAPAMVVGPDELYCYELRDRIYANGEESPATRDRIPPERKRNGRHIDLGTARYYLAWAGSAQRLRGRPCKRVFRSEIDVYPAQTPRGGDPIKATRERVKRFLESTIYDESSPDGDDSRIAELYDAGHRAKWLCKCPHCGTRQELRFFVFRDGERAGRGGIVGYKDEQGNFLSPETVQSAHYVCTEGCVIGQDQKSSFVLNGLWVAPGQTVVDDVVTGVPSRGRRHLSFHIWSIHSPTVTFKDLAVAFLDHRRDGKLREFWQNWLGLRYESRRKLPEWHVLGQKLESNHKRASVPQAAWFLTAGVDVQQDGCYYVVRAWGDQATSWLVEHGYLQRYDTEEINFASMSPEELNTFFRSDIRQIRDAVLNRYFPVVDNQPNPLGQTRLRVRLAHIDSQHRTREVHAFVSSQDERRLQAVRGDHKTKPSDRFRESIIDKPERGGPAYASPRKILNIFTPHYKEGIWQKLDFPAEAPGSFNFYSGVVQTSADYLRQLVNEHPTEVIDKTSGRKKILWKPRSEQWGNHYWDAEVYSFCAAERILHRLGWSWDAATWKAPRATESNERREPFSLPMAAVRDEQLM